HHHLAGRFAPEQLSNLTTSPTRVKTTRTSGDLQRKGFSLPGKHPVSGVCFPLATDKNYTQVPPPTQIEGLSDENPGMPGEIRRSGGVDAENRRKSAVLHRLSRRFP
ncbi:hypothetical protein, partial [Glutamicibacter creatinolyticus]|uniref:hypothetical protein n=2 Tax=Micrococcaceae TaxID=1268 RepID=UPI0031DE9ABA